MNSETQSGSLLHKFGLDVYFWTNFERMYTLQMNDGVGKNGVDARMFLLFKALYLCLL